MEQTVYLVNPRADYPSYFGAEVLGRYGYRHRAALVADLAVSTIAAMIPRDFRVEIVDENISDINFDIDAEIVAITGKVSQWGRMRTIAGEFRKRSKLVIIGGPYASLSPEVVRPYCDILVRGEAEEIVETLFSDVRRGCWKDEYVGGKPPLSDSPIPRWRCYPNDRALSASVQTSRGCPFECEFCDVIQYLGRKQRHKHISQVIDELDEVYRFGYRAVFLCDDNFTVYRARAKELLAALGFWNRQRKEGKVEFATQLSIDAARDDELLQLCAEAGLTKCFIGIETPNEESLRETKKRQNLRVDLVDQIQRFLDHGILVIGGMIVGFDHDTPTIFDQQYEFAMSSGIPIFTVGALVAPPTTPLHERLAKEGRVIVGGSETGAGSWDTNIVPKTMTREELLGGVRCLCDRLYEPAAFGERVLQFVSKMGKRRDPKNGEQEWPPQGTRQVEMEAFRLIADIPRLGPAEAKMWARISQALRRKREATAPVFSALLQYRQIRYMFENGQLWDPHPAA